MWPFRKKTTGPTVLEVLRHQNIMMASIVNRLDVLANYKSATDQNILRVLESLSASAPAMQGRSLKEMEDRLMDIIDLMRAEPFAALKSWIDAATAKEARSGRIIADLIDVERTLLSRWDAQVKELKAVIANRHSGE